MLAVLTGGYLLMRERDQRGLYPRASPAANRSFSPDLGSLHAGPGEPSKSPVCQVSPAGKSAAPLLATCEQLPLIPAQERSSPADQSRALGRRGAPSSDTKLITYSLSGAIFRATE